MWELWQPALGKICAIPWTTCHPLKRFRNPKIERNHTQIQIYTFLSLVIICSFLGKTHNICSFDLIRMKNNYVYSITLNSWFCARIINDFMEQPSICYLCTLNGVSWFQTLLIFAICSFVARGRSHVATKPP